MSKRNPGPAASLCCNPGAGPVSNLRFKRRIGSPRAWKLQGAVRRRRVTDQGVGVSATSSSTRQRIVLAALDVFARRGYAAGTIREIVERARANQAAVNYHFGGKESLYRDVLKYSFRRATGGDAWADIPIDGPPAIRLRRVVELLLHPEAAEDERRAHARLIAWEMLSPTGALSDLAAGAIGPQVDAVAGMLRELLPADAAPATARIAALWLIGQCTFFDRGRDLLRDLELEPPGAPAPRGLVDRIVELALHGLAGLGAGIEPGRKET